MKYEILSALDNIEIKYMESDLEMLDMLTAAYERAAVVLEHREDPEAFSDFEIFQEGEILDKAMGNKYENVFKRIIAFIPRLLIATAESIGKTFSKENNEQMESGIDGAINTMQNGTPQQKHQLVTYVNNNSEGNVKMNDDGTIETPTFKVGLLGHLEFLKSSKEIMDRIKQEMDPNSATAYQQLADNIQNILDKREEFNSNTAKLTLDALRQCGKDIVTLAPALTESISVVGKELNKQIKKMEQSGTASQEEINKQKAARNALSKLQLWSKMISRGNTAYQGVKKLFSAFTKDINPFHKKNNMTDAEREAIIDQRRENSAARRDIEMVDNARADDDETKAKREKLNQMKREITEQKQKLANYQYNEQERAQIQNRINELSNTISTLEAEIQQRDPSYESNAGIERSNLNKEKTKAENDINQLNKRKTELQNKLNGIPNNNAFNKLKRQKLEKEITMIDSNISKLNSKVTDLDARISAVV